MHVILGVDIRVVQYFESALVTPIKKYLELYRPFHQADDQIRAARLAFDY